MDIYEPGVVRTPFVPLPGRQRQVDLCGLRPAWSTKYVQDNQTGYTEKPCIGGKKKRESPYMVIF